MEESFFSRSELMLGKEAAISLADVRILIVGCGGVGGWCAEALARTGARHLSLVDSDLVAPSNVNRQVMARPSTVGLPKVEALRDHLLEISPEAEVSAHCLRYMPNTPHEPPFDFARYDFVIDAIDSVDAKAALIGNALAAPDTTLFSSMGAALRFDPTAVLHSDFRKVEGDRLARALRMRFKKLNSWPARSFTCVWSTERPYDAARADGCNGSLMQVTAAFGLTLALLVVKSIVNKARA